MTQFDLSSGNYNEADASNNNPGAAGWAIGQAPSNVGAAGRAFMGSVKRAYDWDHGGTWAVVSGTANAIVITYPVAPSAYVQGQKHAFKATAANTGAATVNINGLGVKNIFQRSPTGPAALLGGEIQVGDIVELAYDGTEFVMVGMASNLISESINAQTGTSYTVVAADRGKLLTFANAAAIAVTLPQATGSFGAGWFADFSCLASSTGAVTITPTTSTVDGGASLILLPGQSCRIVSDGTNYQILRGAAIKAQSLNAAGYVKFSSGMIIQWGSFAYGTTTAGTTYTTPIAFPTAFPNAVFGVFTTAQTQQPNNVATGVSAAPTVTGSTIYTFVNAVFSSLPISWLAIGY